ncbi:MULTISPECIES: zinc ribbon domain-containing protein [unclassified Borrelia]|uniref:zinc ribbon domain-containing protein n=1 Tax=unclassified Borrelia TaxID=2649934 RepID=UPI001E3CBB1E|nr:MULTISPECIES: zinc ribbon domain-containing protein [unclassified Borrelia]UGQ16365.1 zinc ribbon domain-containing protein [Borrelia sp. RT5S]UGQ17485.1 zinc ribbon domain-containing protein [Borrelia sp. RT1S]
MESNIDILKNLEGIYKTRFELEERQKSIPKYLQVKKSQIDELIEVLDGLQVKFKECQKEDSSLKLGIQDINVRKTKAEEKIDSIKTQREYEALEKELQTIIDDEVAIRKKMTHITGLKTRVDREITELKGKLEGEQSIYAAESAELEDELLGIKQKLLDITNEEGKYAFRMDEDFLFKFQRIIRNKSNGVVPLVENVCKGCNMILPVEFANKVRREPDEVKFCPYCSRILYYQEGFEVGLGMIPGSLADLVE